MDYLASICILTIILTAVILTIYFLNKRIKYWTGIEGSSIWNKELTVNPNLTTKQRTGFLFTVCVLIFLFVCAVYLITHSVGVFGGFFVVILILYVNNKNRNYT